MLFNDQQTHVLLFSYISNTFLIQLYKPDEHSMHTNTLYFTAINTEQWFQTLGPLSTHLFSGKPIVQKKREKDSTQNILRKVEVNRERHQVARYLSNEKSIEMISSTLALTSTYKGDRLT